MKNFYHTLHRCNTSERGGLLPFCPLHVLYQIHVVNNSKWSYAYALGCVSGVASFIAIDEQLQ